MVPWQECDAEKVKTVRQALRAAGRADNVFIQSGAA